MAVKQNQKALHITLWVLQVLLGLAFIMAGFLKIIQSIDQLAAKGMSFVNEYSEGAVRFIGITELLGGLGLILPAALRIKPILTPVAATGLAIVMALATFYHIGHAEPIVSSVMFFVISTFVAWGRFKMVPIQSK